MMGEKVNDADNFCRVCGFDCGEPLWVDDGTTPTYLICPCCGAESGLDDETPEQVRQYRDEWLMDNTKWARQPISFSWWGKAGWTEKYEAYLATAPHWFAPEERPDVW